MWRLRMAGRGTSGRINVKRARQVMVLLVVFPYIQAKPVAIVEVTHPRAVPPEISGCELV